MENINDSAIRMYLWYVDYILPFDEGLQSSPFLDAMID
jgi:hypothetical protein